jgi:hypothetical protein
MITVYKTVQCVDPLRGNIHGTVTFVVNAMKRHLQVVAQSSNPYYFCSYKTLQLSHSRRRAYYIYALGKTQMYCLETESHCGELSYQHINIVLSSRSKLEYKTPYLGPMAPLLSLTRLTNTRPRSAEQSYLHKRLRRRCSGTRRVPRGTARGTNVTVLLSLAQHKAKKR